MDLYRSTFAGLLLLNSLVFIRSYRTKTGAFTETPPSSEKVEHRGREEDDVQRVRRLKWKFFPVFLLVNGADWLQGPYIYPIYKDEKGLAESTVALLFMVGFLSGGISASFAGTIADRFGRKAACLAYCVFYSFSCLTLLTNRIEVLFLGRVLGGVSGTLLYSVFESWLVAEFNKLMVDDEDSNLSGIFSMMTTLNSFVAIVAGIVAGWLVDHVGTAKAPFMASMGCMMIAFIVISNTWSENYGSRQEGTGEATSLLAEEAKEEYASPKSALQLILGDKNVLTLALTSCFFEGSLFLFIFFKFPALKLSHELSGSTTDLPFGLIFAILMCCMMFGSMLYNNLSTSTTSLPTKQILIYTLAAASLCFFLPAHIREENIVLWCFCIFEMCCGIYYPAMGSLKSKLVEDGMRASVYTILRVPLNAFVVLALSMTREGEHHRNMVFTLCSGLLLAAALVVYRVLA
ncbi:DUF791-domain-containing protein [Bimuria novae-zelandiae CBS 107.79]|uniref:Molybdate-anion transporter n=1 Tax=Bimuria novae-zelandiae CBS 107.79 TaxID=1447943 RepID=A0A6A5UMN5_9PLEO|nr:DUF791-domain-containing protein [Bimuria novae-zelandiae CBS 107.79]